VNAAAIIVLINQYIRAAALLVLISASDSEFDDSEL